MVAPTRFYMPGTGSNAYTTPFDSLWDASAVAVRRMMSTAKTNTGSTLQAGLAETVTTSPYDVLGFQFISSQQMANDGVIGSGNATLVFSNNEGSFGADAFMQAVIKVVSADGNTERGKLYAGATQTAVVATEGAQNQELGTSGKVVRIWDQVPLNQVTVQQGDRLCFELGIRFCNTTATSMSGSFLLGDPTAGDFPKTPSSNGTLALASWIEFSEDILTPVAEGNGGGGVSEGLSDWIMALPGLTGSLQDRQYQFLKNEGGTRKTSADMQVELGKEVREILKESDWV